MQGRHVHHGGYPGHHGREAKSEGEQHIGVAQYLVGIARGTLGAGIDRTGIHLGCPLDFRGEAAISLVNALYALNVGMTSADFKPHPSLLPPTIPNQICIAYEQGADVVCTPFGGVAERLNAPVLKTGDGRPSVGSNPTSSAIFRKSPRQPGCRGLFAIRTPVLAGHGVVLDVGGWYLLSISKVSRQQAAPA